MENSKQTQKKVFITGATGFLASHCIKLLLEKNYYVIASTRCLKNPLIKELKKITPNAKENLKIIKSDLLDPEIWKKNLKGCDYLLHLASPVFMKAPEDENEILRPAIEGTKNILEAAIINNLKKVVLTSSIAAVQKKKEKNNNWKTSKDFSDFKSADLYTRSKVGAELQALELVEKYKQKLNLSIICPGIILDEILTSRRSPCNVMTKILFDCPFLVDVYLPIVSARDCALAHLKCLEFAEISRGKRYLVVENCYSFRDLVLILKSEFEKFGYSFFKIGVPDFLFKASVYLHDNLKVFYNFRERDLYDNYDVKHDLGVLFENHRKFFLRAVYSMIKNKKLENKIDN